MHNKSPISRFYRGFCSGGSIRPFALSAPVTRMCHNFHQLQAAKRLPLVVSLSWHDAGTLATSFLLERYPSIGSVRAI